MGFARELNAILETLPKNRQGMFFSATIPADIERLAHTHLKDTELITLSSDQVGALEVAHYVYVTRAGDKIGQLVRILEVEDPESAIIFCNTRDETQRVAEALKARGFDADWLNGDLPQGDRERVMNATREGRLRFLVCTDVAARGIDISHLTHVINYDFPETAEQYVHRTGRTGRAGRTGTAIALVGPEGHRKPLPPASHLQDPPDREAAPQRGRGQDARGDGSPPALRRRVRQSSGASGRSFPRAPVAHPPRGRAHRRRAAARSPRRARWRRGDGGSRSAASAQPAPRPAPGSAGGDARGDQARAGAPAPRGSAAAPEGTGAPTSRACASSAVVTRGRARTGTGAGARARKAARLGGVVHELGASPRGRRREADSHDEDETAAPLPRFTVEGEGVASRPERGDLAERGERSGRERAPRPERIERSDGEDLPASCNCSSTSENARG